MKIVIALGGNAVLKKGDNGEIEEQIKNIKKTAKEIAKLIKKGHKIIITHGNGPQVGNLFIQQKKSKKTVAPMPLDVLGAMTQGELGYLIQQSLREYCKKEIATIVTEIEVDKNDPAFKNPTKPIGPFYESKISEGMIYDAGRGYRKVVASPEPKKILGLKTIKKLVNEGTIVIAAGGGGIPVIKGKGIEAVIDKDKTSQLLGNKLGFDILLMVTSVSCVYLNFRKKNQKPIFKMKVKNAKKYLKEDQFPEGSMKPKIESAIEFIEKGGKKAIITSLDKIEDAIKGRAGTTIL